MTIVEWKHGTEMSRGVLMEIIVKPTRKLDNYRQLVITSFIRVIIIMVSVCGDPQNVKTCMVQVR